MYPQDFSRPHRGALYCHGLSQNDTPSARFIYVTHIAYIRTSLRVYYSKNINNYSEIVLYQEFIKNMEIRVLALHWNVRETRTNQHRPRNTKNTDTDKAF